MVNPIIVIPARLGSTRLPNKPLADIKGLPMIVRVMKQAEAAQLGRVIIACDSQEIADVVEAHKGTAVITDPDLPSGSDRIRSALAKIDPNADHDVVINLQGDLPTIDPDYIQKTLLPFEEASDVDIVTLVSEITDEAEKTNPNVVKAVISWINDQHGRALYFTRATAPTGNAPLYHHIGIYAYTRKSLEHFCDLPPSPLEQSEKLEQLRALEANMRIDAVKVENVPLGVDTQADLDKVIASL